MHSLIKILACIIILLGLVHISFAFPFQMSTGALWFTGAGMAIILAGLLNLVAIHRGGSRFTRAAALFANLSMGTLFCLALPILHQPQVYAGIIIFLAAAIAFTIKLIKPGP